MKRNANLKTKFLSSLAAPTGRASANNGVVTLQQLAKFSEEEILPLHGMGLSSLPKIRSALETIGL